MELSLHALPQWVCFFYIYCFLGWIWESCYVSVKEKHLVNRGFMKGPLLPIYGSGAICILMVTIRVRDNYILMAVVGMVAATVLEYVTGAVMEALFKVRYWDYTGEFLSLNGYVCLKSTLCWGVMTFLVTYVIHPPIAQLVHGIRNNVLYTMDFVVTALAAADFATSFKAAIDFRDILLKAEKLKEEMRSVQERLDELEKLLSENASRAVEGISGGVAKVKESISGGAARMKEAAVEKTKGLTGGRKDREALQAERQELLLRKRMGFERLHSVYSRSIDGLLKRNPGTVSEKHSEALTDIKASIREHMEKAKAGEKK